MSVDTDDIPAGVMRLRVKGLPLTRAPQAVDAEGFGVFGLNDAKVDWADSCNAAYRQIHGDRPTPESDRRYEDIMRARTQREVEAKKEKAAA